MLGETFKMKFDSFFFDSSLSPPHICLFVFTLFSPGCFQLPGRLPAGQAGSCSNLGGGGYLGLSEKEKKAKAFLAGRCTCRKKGLLVAIRASGNRREPV